MATEARRIAVLALGSVLEGDDGAGPAALAELQARWQLPPEVTTAALGTPGPDLAEYLRGFDAAILLDAVRSRLPAGTVLVEDDPARVRSAPARMSPHDPSLGEALERLALEGALPEEVVVVGVVPLRVGLGTELSEEVVASLPILAETVAHRLRRLGATPHLREYPLEANRWWLRAGSEAKEEVLF